MSDALDLIVLGGGAGGLSASRAALREGKRPMMITDSPPGGDCTFTGCVPSKTLIKSAADGLDFAAAMSRVKKTVAHIASTEDVGVLESEGIQVLTGRGRLRGRGQVEVEGRILRADRIVVATGGRAALPPIEGLDGVPTLTNESLWDLDTMPARFGIIGGGPIGVEMAQAFARLGSAVTVFEVSDRLLGRSESAASSLVADALAADGVEILTGANIMRVSATGGLGVQVELDRGDQPPRTIGVDALLVAAGRTANTEDLGLDTVGALVDGSGNLVVDEHLETTAEGVFGVGDVTGLLQLTHAADEMGRIAVKNGFRFRRTAFDTSAIADCVFTAPEVAHVGVIEEEVAGQDGVRVAELPMAANDRAIAEGLTDGFIKLISGPQPLIGNRLGGGRLIGATIVGERAGEMIHEPALAIATGMFTGRLAQLPHAYPTWSIGVQKCAAQFFTEVEGRSARSPRRS